MIATFITRVSGPRLFERVSRMTDAGTERQICGNSQHSSFAASSFNVLLAVGLLLLGIAGPAVAQEPTAPQATSAEQLTAAIGHLGDLDYTSRTTAARTIRRVPGSQAVPALLTAVSEHSDGYVRYRALVLLTGFNDPRTIRAMTDALTNPNDRLRAVAYAFFERNPEPSVTEKLITALDTEPSEFVRPALIRALAARTQYPSVRRLVVREVGRGQDFFRSVVIEAVGDYKVLDAFDALVAIAKLDGPLLDDTALSLGKLGDRRGLEILSGLQRTAPRTVQPSVAAGICLLDVDCAGNEKFLVDSLAYSDRAGGQQELLRSAAAGLGALGVAGRQSAVEALLRIGVPSKDPTRAPVALSLAMVALRNTPVVLSVLGAERKDAAASFDLEGSLTLLAEGFDMLDEDLEKERFFAFVRRSYWAAAEGSPTRALMQTLIEKLDF